MNATPSLNQCQNHIVSWANGAFPNRTPKDVLLKLYEEIGELVKNPADSSESADVMILLLDFLHFYEISGDDLARAIFQKMEVNKHREWRVDQRTGIMQHV